MEFKGIDYVVGEIVEAPTKQILIANLNDRFEAYKSQGQQPFVVCVEGVYYLGIK